MHAGLLVAFFTLALTSMACAPIPQEPVVLTLGQVSRTPCPDAASCLARAREADRAGRVEEARRFYGYACEQGHRASCTVADMAFPARFRRAVRSCLRGEPQGCEEERELRREVGVDPDLRAVYGGSCDAGDVAACYCSGVVLVRAAALTRSQERVCARHLPIQPSRAQERTKEPSGK